MNQSREGLREWLEMILIAILLAVVIKAFLYDLILVDGNSMMPTLVDSERLIVSKIDYLIHSPKQGDIAIFRYPHEPKINFIKRVIAISGDTIEIKDGEVWLNDVLFKEPYIKEKTIGDFAKRVVPENTIFVLGDNRNNSKDSRFEDVGFIPVSYVKGKAVIKVWPIKNISKIENVW
ncbi:MAG: signal peptidase I [Thermotaleaceae bacterium]